MIPEGGEDLQKGKDNVIGTIGPFYSRGHRGPHRIRESHRGTLLVRVGALSQSHGCLTPKSGFFSLSYAFYLTFHLLLLFHCWKSYVFNKTINSTRARTMLPIPFDNAWHKTGPCLCAQARPAVCSRWSSEVVVGSARAVGLYVHL